MMKPLLVAVKACVLLLMPVVLEAGHHPTHRAMGSEKGGATLWIFLAIIAFVGIMAWLGRKRK